jgi:hypothetical protein
MVRRGGRARVGEHDRAALKLIGTHPGAVSGPERDGRERHAGEVVGGAVVLWDGQVVGELQRILDHHQALTQRFGRVRPLIRPSRLHARVSSG